MSCAVGAGSYWGETQDSPLRLHTSTKSVRLQRQGLCRPVDEMQLTAEATTSNITSPNTRLRAGPSLSHRYEQLGFRSKVVGIGPLSMRRKPESHGDRPVESDLAFSQVALTTRETRVAKSASCHQEVKFADR